jgi:hypothetical protein
MVVVGTWAESPLSGRTVLMNELSQLCWNSEVCIVLLLRLSRPESRLPSGLIAMKSFTTVRVDGLYFRAHWVSSSPCVHQTTAGLCPVRVAV